MHTARLVNFDRNRAYFVVRAVSDLRYRTLKLLSHSTTPQIVADEEVMLSGQFTRRAYPQSLRRVIVDDVENSKTLFLLTNNFALPASHIARLYKSRWQIELFFKCIKQHLRITRFIGNSENAVKVQVWTAISAYVLVAIIKRRLGCDTSLHEMFQILSLTLFETTPLQQLFTRDEQLPERAELQISLFEKRTGH